MRILLVNNGDTSTERLLQIIGDKHTVTVVDWKSDSIGDDSLYDLIILSGGRSEPIAGNEKILKSEMELIAKTKKPLLGICYGCELIAFVFGAHLERLESVQKGMIDIDVVGSDPLFVDSKHFQAYDSHHWTIKGLSPELTAIASSIHGIEAIKHASRPIYGLQFHPEKCEAGGYGEKMLSHYFMSLEKSHA